MLLCHVSRAIVTQGRNEGINMQKQIVKNKDVQIVNKTALASLLIDADEVKAGRGSKSGKGARYAKYTDALRPHLSWLRDTIKDSKDGHIRMRVKDLTKEMGTDFVNKNPTSIYWGTKYALYKQDIIVTTGQNNAGEDLLVMRTKIDGDKLPDSLMKEYIKEMGLVEVKMLEVKVKPEVPKVIKVPMQRRLITAMRIGSESESEIEGELVQA